MGRRLKRFRKFRQYCIRGHDLSITRTFDKYGEPKDCSECKYIRLKVWYANNKVRSKEWSKEWILQNPEKIKRIRNSASSRYRLTEKGRLRKKNRSFVRTCINNGLLMMNGVCSWCGFVGYTEIHHELYHDPPMLKDIKELCKECHVIADSVS